MADVIQFELVDRIKVLRVFRKRVKAVACDSAYLIPFTLFEKEAFSSLSNSLNTSLKILDDVLSQKTIKK